MRVAKAEGGAGSWERRLLRHFRHATVSRPHRLLEGTRSIPSTQDKSENRTERYCSTVATYVGYHGPKEPIRLRI